MIDRRQLLTVGGLLGALAPAGDEAAYGAGQMSDRYVPDFLSAIKNISNAISLQQSFDVILPVRTRQVDFLKAQGKFPDFIDVGIDIWYAVHDWHIRLQQQLVFGRDPVGRYTLMLGFTALVLRADSVASYISTPYDSR